MVSLRPALRQDAAAIRRLVRQAHINPTGLDWPRFMVAVAENGEIVGCVQIKPHKDGTRELASLAVKSAWQGQGVARKLIEAMLSRESGTLYLMCRSGLVPLYTKFGFTVLEPPEMPAEFLKMYQLVRRFQRMFGSAEGLSIMRRAG